MYIVYEHTHVCTCVCLCVCEMKSAGRQNLCILIVHNMNGKTSTH